MKLNCDYTFENYLVGTNNKTAKETVLLAMIVPGQIHNPLFIYGATGTGKSHLLQALAHEVSEHNPSLKIYYAPIEQFINDITRSIQKHRYLNFIEYCLNLDGLLIDDIHLIKNRRSTLKELLYIFERLYNAQKQVIVSADRSPEQIFGTKASSAEIFQKGLILKIRHPSYKDRLKFLQIKAQNAGLLLSNDIFEDLARKAHPDLRELEGILAKIKLSSSYLSTPYPNKII